MTAATSTLAPAPTATSMRAGASNSGVGSLWQATIRDKRGRIKFIGQPRPNVRTNAGGDWQAAAMCGQSGATSNPPARAMTSIAGTTLTDTGAAFPTAANITGVTGGLVGRMVAVGPNSSGTGSTVYGVIITNTATAVTVDRWVAAGSPFAAGTTPNGTGNYQILPGNAPAWFMALSSTVQAGAVGDTVLAGELTTNGFARAAPTTITHTLASASWSVANTYTASGNATINSEALFNASGTAGQTATTGGVMPFESAEPSAPTLVSGDTVAQTVTVSY